MTTNPTLSNAARSLVEAVERPTDVRRSHELERMLRELLEGRAFVNLKSPDGSVWRLRINNAGTLTTSKVTP